MGRTYRIGEAAELLHLKTYVLRFWETVFPQLAPLRTDTGQRLYTEEHMELLRRIQHLLHVQGMTIEGANKALLSQDSAEDIPLADPELLVKVCAELGSIREMLLKGPTQSEL